VTTNRETEENSLRTEHGDKGVDELERRIEELEHKVKELNSSQNMFCVWIMVLTIAIVVFFVYAYFFVRLL
jgi:hypothetical protein